MKLTNTQQKLAWLQDAGDGFGARIWGNPFRTETKYQFKGFSDKTEPKKIKRNGQELEINERFILIENLTSNQEMEVNCKYFFTTYNESEDLMSPTIYGLGDGVKDPVEVLFEAVEASKEFTIEHFDAYSLDFAHWQQFKERKLKLNSKAIKYIIA